MFPCYASELFITCATYISHCAPQQTLTIAMKVPVCGDTWGAQKLLLDGIQQNTEHTHGVPLHVISSLRFNMYVSSTILPWWPHSSTGTAARVGKMSGAGAPLRLAFHQRIKTSMASRSGLRGSHRRQLSHKYSMGTQARVCGGRRARSSTAVRTALSTAR